jgi:poly-gamma-glutamate synthesis protein (capsule biosynthesis protein)
MLKNEINLLKFMHYLRGYSFVFIGVLFFLLGSPFFKNDLVLISNSSSVVQSDTIPFSKTPKIVIRISSVGDIMVHQTQLTAQKKSDGTYGFDNNFQFMKGLFESSDVMIGNLETNFAGEKKGYTAYPQFNSPDALASAIKNSGINLVATANNHTYDNGGEAMLRTLDILREQGLETFGTQKTTEEKNYVIRDVKGVKIGFASYTYESGKNPEGLKAINGLTVGKAYEPLLNSFDPYDVEEDLAEMQNVVAKMKADSAEFIVFVMHWGVEYKPQPSNNQMLVAKALNEAGVDVIFGSHPHVVQPIDFIVNDSTQHMTFVAYSMGNFISNQRYESMQNYSTEDGLYVGVEIEKDGNSKPVLKQVFYEPTWVNRYKKGDKYYFEVVPARIAKENKDVYNIFEDAIEERVKASCERTMQMVENPLFENSEIFFSRYLKSHKILLAK